MADTQPHTVATAPPVVKPARTINALLDEWVWWAYDDGPIITRTGGPSTRVND